MPIHRHRSSSETVVCIRGHFEEYYNNELIKLCKKAFINKDNGELGEWTDVNKAPQI